MLGLCRLEPQLAWLGNFPTHAAAGQPLQLRAGEARAVPQGQWECSRKAVWQTFLGSAVIPASSYCVLEAWHFFCSSVVTVGAVAYLWGSVFFWNCNKLFSITLLKEKKKTSKKPSLFNSFENTALQESIDSFWKTLFMDTQEYFKETQQYHQGFPLQQHKLVSPVKLSEAALCEFLFLWGNFNESCCKHWHSLLEKVRYIMPEMGTAWRMGRKWNGGFDVVAWI